MAQSKNTIARMALSHLGGTARVEDIDTEQTAEARQLKLWYDEARRMALSDFDWGFARKRLILETSPDDPPDEWAFRYKYPTTCLMARRIENPAGPDADDQPFEIDEGVADTKTILTNAEDAILVFTRDVLTTDLFSPHFTVALSYLWAHFVAQPVTGQSTKKDKMLENYLGMIELAAERSANEETQRKPRDADWIRER